MAFEHKEGFGAIFENIKKKETHPDYKGEIMIDGEVRNIAGWEKRTKSGKLYFSLSVEKPNTDDDAPF